MSTSLLSTHSCGNLPYQFRDVWKVNRHCGANSLVSFFLWRSPTSANIFQQKHGVKSQSIYKKKRGYSVAPNWETKMKLWYDAERSVSTVHRLVRRHRSIAPQLKFSYFKSWNSEAGSPLTFLYEQRGVFLQTVTVFSHERQVPSRADAVAGLLLPTCTQSRSPCNTSGPASGHVLVCSQCERRSSAAMISGKMFQTFTILFIYLYLIYIFPHTHI